MLFCPPTQPVFMLCRWWNAFARCSPHHQFRMDGRLTFMFFHLPKFCCISDTLHVYKISSCSCWVLSQSLAPAHILQEVTGCERKTQVRTWRPTDTEPLRHRPRPRTHDGKSSVTDRLSGSAPTSLFIYFCQSVCSTSHFCVTCYPKLKALSPTPFASLPLLRLFSSCLRTPKGKWLSTTRWRPQEARTLTVCTFRLTALPN